MRQGIIGIGTDGQNRTQRSETQYVLLVWTEEGSVASPRSRLRLGLDPTLHGDGMFLSPENNNNGDWGHSLQSIISTDLYSVRVVVFRLVGVDAVVMQYACGAEVSYTVSWCETSGDVIGREEVYRGVGFLLFILITSTSITDTPVGDGSPPTATTP